MDLLRFRPPLSLFLIIGVLGCTSSSPNETDSANQVITTKTARRPQDPMATTLAALESITGGTDDCFVNSIRQWRDKEGQYSTNAELVAVSIENRSVKLLKENGVAIDVPVDRLSLHDRNFLVQAVHALRDQLLREELEGGKSDTQ